MDVLQGRRRDLSRQIERIDDELVGLREERRVRKETAMVYQLNHAWEEDEDSGSGASGV